MKNRADILETLEISNDEKQQINISSINRINKDSQSQKFSDYSQWM